MIRRADLLLLAALWGCGAAPARDARSLSAELHASLEAARERAGPAVADAEQALREAESAELAGDLVGGAEHRARARLAAARATEVAAARAETEARSALEAETASALEEALALDTESAAIEAEASRIAATRTAREETLRALRRAETDEARGRRRIHLSLDDEAAMRGAARDLRQRAQLLLGAAIAIAARNGTTIEAPRAEAERLVAASSAASEPLEALRSADAAHDAARTALGQARRGAPVDEAQVRALLEAAASEGFEAVQLERGVAIDVSSAFEAGRAPTGAGAGRLRRLSALVASHPAGPAVVEVAASGALAEARAGAIRSALEAGGVEASRIEVRARDEVATSARVVLPSYAIAMAGAGPMALDAPAPSAPGAGVDAHPTPDAGEE